MSAAMKLVAAVVALTVAAAAGALGVVALTDEDVRGAVTLRSESAPATPALGPAAAERIEPDDRPLWPEEAQRARRAALEATGGGAISELDRSDDPGEAYEVEVIKDGREHDIALDLDFEPVPNRRYDD